ncbi:MAG: hypothetical protein AAB316_11955, partial [Bacteroidota bacterium]
MKRLPSSSLRLLFSAFFASSCLTNCQEKQPASNADATFIERKNAEHNGDYLATYPLSNPDSCIIRLKAEVPASVQPWACLALWYHLPRTSPATSFRLLELYEKNYPHDTVTAFVQMVRGEWYVDLAKYDSAQICLNDAFDKYTKLNRPLDASDATYLKARIQVYQNNFPAAIQAYFQVLDLVNAHDTTFSERHANLFDDLAVAYEGSRNKPKFLHWLNKAWNADHAKLANPDLFKRRIAKRFAFYYLDEKPDSSLYWAKLAFDLNSQQKAHTRRSPEVTYTLARAYFKNENCPAALPLFLQAFQGTKNVPKPHFQVSRSLGECYLCLGKLDSAKHYLQFSLASPDTVNLASAQKILGELYAKTGDWKMAFEASRENLRLFEVVVNAEKAKKTAALETQYETAQKERRIAELQGQQQAARLQNWIVSLSLLLVLGMAVGLFFWQRGRRRLLEQEKILLQQEKELAQAYAELKTQELEHSQADLQLTQSELDNAARLLSLKNQLIEDLQLRLEGQPQTLPGIAGNSTESHHFRSMKILTKDDWMRFRERFEQVFPNFIYRLKKNYPDLSAGEVRRILLMKLDFDKDEMVGTLGISEDSVLRSRRRLSQKLGLVDSKHLNSF